MIYGARAGESRSVGPFLLDILDEVTKDMKDGTISRDSNSIQCAIYSRVRGNSGASLIAKINGEKHMIGNLSSVSHFGDKSTVEDDKIAISLNFSSFRSGPSTEQEMITFKVYRDMDEKHWFSDVNIENLTQGSLNSKIITSIEYTVGEYHENYFEELKNWGLGLFAISVATSLGLLAVFNRNKDKSK